MTGSTTAQFEGMLLRFCAEDGEKLQSRILKRVMNQAPDRESGHET